jgi:hypothetical protein
MELLEQEDLLKDDRIDRVLFCTDSYIRVFRMDEFGHPAVSKSRAGAGVDRCLS